ncbi:MAG: MSCRAMM family protein [Janthinobacterium lividum]
MKPIIRWSTLNAMLLLLAAAALSQMTPARSAPLVKTSASLGTVSGRVTLDDGKPAVGYSIIARSTRYVTPAPSGEAVTDADGRYTLTIDTGLSPGVFQGVTPPPVDTQFVITAEGQEPLYLVPPDQTVTLPPNLTLRGVDFRLSTGPQIMIHVHDALTGLPVPGVTAKYPLNRFSNNDYHIAGVTDAQGQVIFRVPMLEVQISLVPPGGDVPTIIAAPGYNLYREISLPQIKDVVWDVKTYPAVAPTPPSLWHGVVLDSDGRPAAGARVSILRSSGEGTAVTDKKGEFSVSLLPLTLDEYSGDYRGVAVLAEKDGQSAVFAPTPDSTWTGMTVHLTKKPLASYAGMVIGADGRPEAGVPVSCRGGTTIAFGAGLTRSVLTDAAGRFLLSGLPAGRYQVNLGGGTFGLVTKPASDPGYPFSSTLLTLGDGEQHDFGRVVVLPADEILAGQIVDHDGKPVTSGLTAIVHGAHTSQTASLDNTGQFHTYHIVRESLTLDLYRNDKNGGVQLGQASPDLFLKVPVQAGREDVHVVLPAGALPPPTAPSDPAASSVSPAAPPLVGPPLVSALMGMQQIATLWLTYSQETAVSDPQQAHIHAMLGKEMGGQVGPGTLWQGSMAEMDGMKLVDKDNHGVLTDKAGHILWTGLVQPPDEQTAYTAIYDNAKPDSLILRDSHDRTLWSGPVSTKTSSIVFLDGYIAVIGPKNRIVWQQPAVTGGFIYRMFNHGQADGWAGSGRMPFEGVLHFAAVPCRTVFKAQDGHIIYSGSLLTLMITQDKDPKPVFDIFAWIPNMICPFSVSNFRGPVTCTVYDAQGNVLQTSTVSRST